MGILEVRRTPFILDDHFEGEGMGRGELQITAAGLARMMRIRLDVAIGEREEARTLKATLVIAGRIGIGLVRKNAFERGGEGFEIRVFQIGEIPIFLRGEKRNEGFEEFAVETVLLFESKQSAERRGEKKKDEADADQGIPGDLI